MNLVTDKGFFNLTLKQSSLCIAIFFLASLIVGVIVQSNTVSHAASLAGFIFELVGNLALLFGALWENKYLVLVWLIDVVLFFIGWPIAFFGVIFNYGPYRHISMFDNIFLILIEYIIILIFHLYCARIVYSYFQELRNKQSTPQHNVVV